LKIIGSFRTADVGEYTLSKPEMTYLDRYARDRWRTYGLTPLDARFGRRFAHHGDGICKGIDIGDC